MGSGLILLVIVGAWLAVLVPMALRSHDSTSSLSSVDRFNDAMRSLSRRDPVTRLRERGIPAPTRPARSVPAPREADPHEDPEHLAEMADLEEAPKPALTLAQRRRRVLGALLLVAAASLVGGLVGPSWLLVVAGAFGVLAVAYVVHLRRQALRRAAERRSAARQAGRAAARPSARPARRPATGPWIAGIPERLPARPAPAAGDPRRTAAAYAAPGYEAASYAAGFEPLAADPLEPLEAHPLEAGPTAARYDEPAPVAHAVGAAWSPVPVPVPTYVNAPVAHRRVVDLTQPGRYSEALREAEERLGIVDSGPELDDILDRRRAVNGW